MDGDPPRRDRLFVAVWPPRDIVDVLASLDRDEPGIRWMPPENWHVTLRFLGHADVAEIAERLAAAVLPRVTAVLGPAVTRIGRDVVAVPVVGLDDLARAVCRATADVGRPVDPRPFHGHVTIGRLRHRLASDVAGQRVSARFDVDDVALVRSTTHPGGARYDTLERWPVGSR